VGDPSPSLSPGTIHDERSPVWEFTTPKHSPAVLLHWAFRLGILLQGLDGLLELISRTLFLWVGRAQMTGFIWRITRGELLADPDDLMANSDCNLQSPFTFCSP
jgi:uncharacterized membrane protein